MQEWEQEQINKGTKETRKEGKGRKE